MKTISGYYIFFLLYIFVCVTPAFSFDDPSLNLKYQSLMSVHEKVLSSIKDRKIKDAYAETHQSFIAYLKAEEKNLAIFNETIKYKKEEMNIFKENIGMILYQRSYELSSILHNNDKWLTQKVNNEIFSAFAVVNQRVPYDRGEPYRPTFRTVDKTWKIFVEKEKNFYSLHKRNSKAMAEKSVSVLYETRTQNLRREHKGVMLIKIEKEE